MRLGVAVGDLRKALAEEVRAGERAPTRAVRDETAALQREHRGQITASLGGKARGIANAWRAQVFPRPVSRSAPPAWSGAGRHW